MKTRPIAAALTLAVLGATAAEAQQATAVSLLPPDAARWDVTAHAGWLGGNKSEIAPEWNQWYDAGSFGGSVGYHWTPHVKVEADAAVTTAGDLVSQEQFEIPGQTVPFFRSREYVFRSATVAGGLTYQFLHNTWFHPFAGAGIEFGRETARIETPYQVVFSREGRALALPFQPTTERETTHSVRPYATVGFKWYVSEKAFIRSEVRTTLSTEHAESVAWRGGIGFDF